MNDNSKISVGLLIPAVSIIAFVSMLFSENFIGALFVAIGGMMVWFAYSAVMNAKMPDITGNIVMVFGVLLASAFFLNYGLSTNMFGGFEVKLEGVVGSVLILFFTVLIGGLVGNYLNLKIFSNRTLALITSLLVIFVAFRMALKIFL